jgi:hypothetical protein
MFVEMKKLFVRVVDIDHSNSQVVIACVVPSKFYTLTPIPLSDNMRNTWYSVIHHLIPT